MTFCKGGRTSTSDTIYIVNRAGAAEGGKQLQVPGNDTPDLSVPMKMTEIGDKSQSSLPTLWHCSQWNFKC